MVKPTSVRETRENLADVLGEAYYRNELFRIERKDKPVAYVAGAPTMERLAELFKPSVPVEEDDNYWLARCPSRSHGPKTGRVAPDPPRPLRDARHHLL